MDNCSFCRILQGKAEASILYHDESCIAFMDIQPVNPGHILVIPRVHAPYLSELPEDTGAKMFTTGIRMARALRKSGVKCEAVNLHLADGEAAGQEVFHVHLHVIPRFKGDGFGLKFGPHYGEKPSRASLDDAASKIKASMPAGQ
jgi:histidine triad (HIT) family protein